MTIHGVRVTVRMVGVGSRVAIDVTMTVRMWIGQGMSCMTRVSMRIGQGMCMVMGTVIAGMTMGERVAWNGGRAKLVSSMHTIDAHVDIVHHGYTHRRGGSDIGVNIDI